jgi:hypothetical protein
LHPRWLPVQDAITGGIVPGNAFPLKIAKSQSALDRYKVRMKPSMPQLADIIASIATAPDRSGRNDKRRAPRRGLRLKVAMTRLINGVEQEPETIGLRDLSARGLSFDYRSVIERDEQFVLELPWKTDGIVRVLCTAAHCRTIDGLNRIGAEFTCVLETSCPIAGKPANEQERIRKSILGN